MTAEKREIMSLNFVAEKRAWPLSLPAAPGLLSSSGSMVILKSRIKYLENFASFYCPQFSLLHIFFPFVFFLFLFFLFISPSVVQSQNFNCFLPLKFALSNLLAWLLLITITKISKCAAQMATDGYSNHVVLNNWLKIFFSLFHLWK